MKFGLSSALNQFQNQWAQSRGGCLIGAATAVLLGVLLMLIPLAQPLWTLSHDLPFTHAPKSADVPGDAVILYMDEASHIALDQPFDLPWDRALHAELLERLAEAGTRAVVFDIIFLGPGPNPLADQQLEAAMRRHGKVVLSGELVLSGTEGVALSTVIPPYELFRNAAAAWGLVNLAITESGTVRQHLHDVSDQLPSLSWAAAEVAGAGVTRAPEARTVRRWLRYYGPSGTLPHVSYHQALSPDGVAPDFFRDKVVFVGARQTTGFSGTAKDEFPTPFSYWWRFDEAGTRKFSSGVEIQTTSFLNLLREDWLRRISPWINLAAIIVCGLIFGSLLAALRPLTAAGLALLGMAGVTFAAWALFWHRNLSFTWLIPIVQIGVALGWAVLYNSMRWYVERKLLMQTLSLHLSPARAKVVMDHPELLHPGADLQSISIMFSDIAGFSRIAEGLPPKVLAELLNKYFETSISIIHKADGTVVKLIGDAIFAIWNAPVAQPDHHVLICNAALQLRDQLVEFSDVHRSLPALRTRVGLHSGVACVGNFGSSSRFDYTAIGDSVNLASRLEGLNKFLGTSVLMTGDMLEQVREQFVTRHVGRFVFKGFERVVEIHELMGRADQDVAICAWHSLFAKGLGLFQAREFEQAAALFRETIAKHPNDGPAFFYLYQIEEFRTTPPSPNWNGEVVLKEK